MKSKKKIEIKSFNNFDNDNDIIATTFYNYKPQATKLENSLGVGIATFPLDLQSSTQLTLDTAGAGITSIDGVAYAKQYRTNGAVIYRLFLHSPDTKLFVNQLFCEDPELSDINVLRFTTPPTALTFKQNEQDVVLLASSEKMMIWQANTTPVELTNVPIITSLCVNDKVLFCTVKNPQNKVWYCLDLNASNVGTIGSKSNYITIPDEYGFAKKVITFNESVYVFCEYGITKINFIKNDSTVSQVYQSNTKIFHNTVSVCGESVYFMTLDGIYSFNGISVEKANTNIDNILSINNENAVSACLGNKYYLALRLAFGDNKTILCESGNYNNNALLVVDTNDFSYQIIRGVDISTLLPVKTPAFEKMLLTFNSAHSDSLGEIKETSKSFNDALPKFWESGNLTEQTNTKLFTKLSIVAKSGVKCEFVYDNNKTMGFTTYQDGVNTFCFRLYCKDIKLQISSNNQDAYVDYVNMEYYEY